VKLKETVSEEALEDQWGVRFIDKVQHTLPRNCSAGLSLGIAIPDYFSNPGISGLKNAIPGIGKVVRDCNP